MLIKKILAVGTITAAAILPVHDKVEAGGSYCTASVSYDRTLAAGRCAGGTGTVRVRGRQFIGVYSYGPCIPIGSFSRVLNGEGGFASATMINC